MCVIIHFCSPIPTNLFRTRKELYNFQHPKNPIFCPNPRKLPLRPWIYQFTTETANATNTNIAKGNAIPMLCLETLLLMSALHFLFLTVAHQSGTTTAQPIIPAPGTVIAEHVLFSANLLDVKIQVKVTGGQFKLSKAFVSSTMHEGKQRIIYQANRKIYVLDPTWVTIIHPNIKHTDALLIVLEGEHAGRFALRICHSRSHSEPTALVSIINRVDSSRPSQTGIEVHIPEKYLAIVFETKEEKKWHAECMQSRRKETRAS